MSFQSPFLNTVLKQLQRYKKNHTTSDFRYVHSFLYKLFAVFPGMTWTIRRACECTKSYDLPQHMVLCTGVVFHSLIMINFVICVKCKMYSVTTAQCMFTNLRFTKLFCLSNLDVHFSDGKLLLSTIVIIIINLDIKKDNFWCICLNSTPTRPGQKPLKF